jgi:hypothetical protein
VIDAKISNQFLFPDEDIITKRSQHENNGGTTTSTTTATTTGVARIAKREVFCGQFHQHFYERISTKILSPKIDQT